MKTQEDWYQITEKIITEEGGGYLISTFYQSSPFNALSSVYPKYSWKPWLFQQIPKQYWKDNENTKSYLHWISNLPRMLPHSTTISSIDISYRRGLSLLRENGGYEELVSRFRQFFTRNSLGDVFDHLDIRHGRKIGVGSRGQQFLFDIIRDLFPSEDIYANFPHPTIRFVNSNKKMELDIFIPSLKIAFEYQGAHHYKNILGNFLGELHQFQQRDVEKRKACEQEGVTLIEVPYWIRLKEGDIKALIVQRRPDVVFSSA